jgi:hypothetical protein
MMLLWLRRISSATAPASLAARRSRQGAAPFDASSTVYS